MSKKEIIYYHLILFFAGATLSLPVLISPISSHWDISPLYIGSTMSISEMFSNYYYYPADTYMFRPFAFILFGSLYNLFGLNNLVFYILKALFLVSFGMLSYRLLHKLTGNEKISFISSFFSMMLPSVLISIYKVPEIEVIAAAFMYASFLAYIKLGKFKEINSRARIYFLLFLIFSVSGIFFKETIRLYIFLILFLYSLTYYKNINKIQKLSFIILAAMVMYFSFGFRPMPTSLTDKMPLTMNHFSFVINSIFFQFTSPFLISGSIILFLFSLKCFLKHFRLPEKIIIPVAIILLGLSLASPTIIPFIYMGLIFFSENSIIHMSFFSYLMIISLVVLLFLGKRHTRLFSGMALIIILSAISYILFFPNSRQFISMRAFITISPFVLYLIFDSIHHMFGYLRTKKETTGRLLLIIIFIFSTFFVYHSVITAINMSQDRLGLNDASYEGKRYISELNLSGSVVFYTNEIYHTEKMDFSAINPSRKTSTDFNIFFLNSNKLSGNSEDIKDELCLKTQGYGNDAYIYIAKPHTTISHEKLSLLRGDFKWTTSETYYWLKPLPSSSQYFLWPWDYGVIESYQKTVYSPETVLDSYLEDNAVLIYDYNYSYFQLSAWLENSISNTLENIPFRTDYEYIIRVYYVNISKLNCTNWYLWETSPSNRKFRFMSQDSILEINNTGNVREKVKLRFEGWSFYRPRTLDIYLNDDFLENSTFSEPMLKKDFITHTVELNPGMNTLRLHSKDGCDISGSVLKEFKDDKRCMSFAFSNITILNLKELSDNLIYGNNWAELKREESVSFRWMSQNATLFFFNDDNYSKSIILDFIADTFDRPRILNLYLNDMLLDQYNISYGIHMTTPILKMIPGENIVMFNTDQGCDPANKSGLSNYSSCISLVIGNLNKISLDKKIEYDERTVQQIMLDKMHYRAFSKNATAYIYNEVGLEQNITFNFSIWNFNDTKILELYLNDNIIGSYKIPASSDTWHNKDISISVNLSSGNNTLKFKSNYCTSFTNHTVNFSGCIGFAIREKTHPIEEIKQLDLSYGQNWHFLETLRNSSWRWMSQNSTLFVLTPKNTGQNTTLNFSLWSFNRPRILDIYINDDYLSSYTITPYKKEYINISYLFDLGKNIIRFHSREGCEIPKEMDVNQDNRCLSFAFENMGVI